MLNIAQVAGYEVVHTNKMVIFFDKLSQRCDPKKPAAPVIKIRLRAISLSVSFQYYYNNNHSLSFFAGRISYDRQKQP